LRAEIGDDELEASGVSESRARGLGRRAAWRLIPVGVELCGGQIEDVDVVRMLSTATGRLGRRDKFVQGGLGEDLADCVS